MVSSSPNIVLSIAGFDPTGGAGVLADIQTLQQNKVQGMAVVTALTQQDEDKVFGVDWQNLDSIKYQLEPVLKRYSIEVIKIGIVESLEVLQQIIDFVLELKPDVRIIWDPILVASSGFEFTGELDTKQLEEVLKKIYLLTPNQQEYEKLTDALGDVVLPTSVLLKGGHVEGENTSDRLVVNGQLHWIEGKRLESEKHGTGCVLSSAIAANLAKGMELLMACQKAKKYIEGYLQSGKGKLGRHFEILIKE